MPTDPSVEDRLKEFLETVRLEPGSDAITANTSIYPTHRMSQTLLQAALPCFTGSEGRGDEVVLGGKLGQGGMGVVFLARQVPLERDVAVKSVPPELEAPETLGALMHEAWVTGVLEHPNIVPVYALGRDASGRPMLVMRRIAGVSWRDVMAGRAPFPSTQGEGVDPDPLVRHIEVLMQVCRAVHFGHDRGIVHCDLKPDNVMIGEFGEVYVLDWGVAHSIRDEAEGRFPMARNIDRPVGTVSYMSPEQARGQGASIGKATDVYQLGAILHEVITGRRRHEGASVLAVMLSASASTPFDYPDSVPAELATLCNRATDPDPARRFEGAEEFRLALALFLRHRGSLVLADEAGLRLADLQDRLGRLQAGEPVDIGDIHDVFGQCRFGFQQALRSWPENPSALDGLQGALACMIGHHLRREELHEAVQLLRELPRPDDALAARVEDLRRSVTGRDRELAELRELQRQVDPRVGRRARSRLMFFVAFLVAGLTLPVAILTRMGILGASPEATVIGAVTLPLLAGLGVLAGRRALLRTRPNRMLAVAILVGLVARAISRIVAQQWSLPVEPMMALELVAYFACTSLLAVGIAPRLAWAAAVYLLAAALALVFPAAATLIVPLANLVVLGIVGLVWRSMGKTEQEDGTRGGG